VTKGGGCDPQRHTAPAASVAVLPDGKRIVTSGPDAVSLWDAATGYETLTLKGGASKLLGRQPEPR
jgi:hypothetical protein